MATPSAAPDYQGPGVAIWIWRPGAALYATRVVGYLDFHGALEIATKFRHQVAEDGRHRGFHDWEAMTDYATDARVILTETTHELLSKVELAHFLLGSAAVAMGVRAANLLLRRFRVHATRAGFHQALRSAIAEPGSG